ncbi:hypothetical protein N431DRAFT_561914 [Stipitochalara longipes BDJ]|nr:hypothetical protein N431DRAFT_561914 [Stipitochalara longipes BDJ]
MSWASFRQTERTEDLAYCLLGIFDVGMPLIYGEGERAFRRLQEEIIKRNNDLTIFAWNEDNTAGRLSGLFALSPQGFSQSHDIKPYHPMWSDPVFALTNKGIRIDDLRLLWKVNAKHGAVPEEISYRITLGLRNKKDGRSDFCMKLQKIAPELFVRDGELIEEEWPWKDSQVISRTQVPLPKFYLYTEHPGDDFFHYHNRYLSIYFPQKDNISIRNVIPESHWDGANQAFYPPFIELELVLAASLQIRLDASTVSVVVCFYFNADPHNPFCTIFDEEKYNQYASWLFRYARTGHDVTWRDVEAEKPEILKFTNEVAFCNNGTTTAVSVSLERGVVAAVSEAQICSIHFSFKKNEPK